MAVFEVQHLPAAERPRALFPELVLVSPSIEIEGGGRVGEGDEPGEF